LCNVQIFNNLISIKSNINIVGHFPSRSDIISENKHDFRKKRQLFHCLDQASLNNFKSPTGPRHTFSGISTTHPFYRIESPDQQPEPFHHFNPNQFHSTTTKICTQGCSIRSHERTSKQPTRPPTTNNNSKHTHKHYTFSEPLCSASELLRTPKLVSASMTRALLSKQTNIFSRTVRPL